MYGCRVDTQPHLCLLVHVLHVDSEEVCAGGWKGEVPGIPRWNVLETDNNDKDNKFPTSCRTMVTNLDKKVILWGTEIWLTLAIWLAIHEV